MAEKKHKMEVVMPQADADALEQDVLDFWEKEQVFEQSLEQRKDREPFTFYDGPPYATGKPHYGHILQSAIKDTVLRLKTMQGYYVPRRVGWDTHGLPIENIVEKELGIATKREIENDIEGFNAKCREMAVHYIDEFTATLKRMGRWASYDNAYFTFDRDYMETEWWAFRQLWDKELVYQDYRSTPYCIRCETPLSNFEVSMGYRSKTDTAVSVLLKTQNPKPKTQKNGRDLFLLIWTTTPWTLPGNVAVAVHPDIAYVSVEHEGSEVIVAKERVETVFGESKEIVRKWSFAELAELRYEPLYGSQEGIASLSRAETARNDDVYRIVAGEHVTTESGTGLVHMAPAFGEEDALVAQREQLPVVRTVERDGTFSPELSEWEQVPSQLPGMPIFAGNDVIAKDLKARGLLFKQEGYKHSYPFCWRCDEPLIYYALESWFVRVSELKDQMVKNNEQIHWIPEHVKEGRFGKGLASAPDWAVSRNRFWSTPMPIWQCQETDCDYQVCVGSVEELQKLAGQKDIKDLHRPYVDEVTWKCPECDGEVRRVEEVLDVWFDSASMPYAQWHYPFERKELVEQAFPADFIAESIEMTRAWFYVIHVLATALTQKDIGLGKHLPAYRNVIASGLIFAEDGQKLSKKLKNYPEIEPTLKEYGADVLRMYLLTSSTLGEPYRFSEKDMRQVKRNVYMTLWNVYSFFTRYAETAGWKPAAEFQSNDVLDRWIWERTNQLEADVLTDANRYRIDAAARHFVTYIDDLSNWYVRRSRSRFQKPMNDQVVQEAFGTLYAVLVRVSKLLAPFAPFVSEMMYRNLTGEQSVHLADLPPEAEGETDGILLALMQKTRDVVSEGLALRAAQKIKVRQPLAELVVVMDDLPDELREMIADEVNVKQVRVSEALPTGEEYVQTGEDSRLAVALNIALTPELKAEGAARELVRHGQMLRRKAGYALDERIAVGWQTDNEGVVAMLDSQKDFVMQALQADRFLDSLEGCDEQAEVKVEGAVVLLGVKGK